MKNLKLNKQTIFTLLGLLVIVGSIPLAVILVKQRQEIRKEAAPYPTASPSENYEQAWRHPVWGRWNTNRICSVTPPTATPTPPSTPPPTVTPPPTITPTPTVTSTPTPTPSTTPTPTPTPTVTSTPTPTVTPTPTPTETPTPTVTPTPTPKADCNEGCSEDSQCDGDLICSSGYCRHKDCVDETDCTCPGPTGTPTPVAQTTSTPGVELPQAGFTLPTFGAAIGGILLIAVSLLFLL